MTQEDQSDGGTAASSAPTEFAARFRECYRALWAVAVAIVRDRTTAEDVVQDAAALALGKLDQFKQGTSFRAWMTQMVRFVALNHARRLKKRRGESTGLSMDSLVSHPPTSRQPATLARSGDLPPDQAWFDDRVAAALASLGETARSCLLLRTLEHLEYAEIAELLGIPEGTAMSHVHRARAHLREQLSEHALAPARKGQGT